MRKIIRTLGRVAGAARLERIVEAMIREGEQFDPAPLDLSKEEASWLLAHFDEVREIAYNETRIAYLQAALLETIPGGHRKIVPLRKRSSK